MARAFYIAAGSRRIAFISKMRYMLPGWKKLLVPFFYLTNNRLGKYAYRKYTD